MPDTRIARTEHVDGSDLAGDRWVQWYLPHWSSREGPRATYDVADPVQLFVGVFGFPDRDDGTLAGHVPTLEVDSITHLV